MQTTYRECEIEFLEQKRFPSKEKVNIMPLQKM